MAEPAHSPSHAPHEPGVLIPHGTELGFVLVGRAGASAVAIAYEYGAEQAPRFLGLADRDCSRADRVRALGLERCLPEVVADFQRELVLGVMLDCGRAGKKLPRWLWPACASLMAEVATRHSVFLDAGVTCKTER